MKRRLGDELAPATLEGLAGLRLDLEARGVPVDGWCVPRGEGDCALEGRWHGGVAALFDRFYLNLEAGWAGFWERGPDAAAADAYLGGFWTRLRELGADRRLNRQVGVTWVANVQADRQFGAMPRAMTDASMAAWIGGTNYYLLETYGPGGEFGGACDPARDVPAWRAHLRHLGVKGTRAVVPMLAPRNDWTSQAARWGRGTRGAHQWTLYATAQALGWSR